MDVGFDNVKGVRTYSGEEITITTDETVLMGRQQPGYWEFLVSRLDLQHLRIPNSLHGHSYAGGNTR